MTTAVPKLRLSKNRWHSLEFSSPYSEGRCLASRTDRECQNILDTAFITVVCWTAAWHLVSHETLLHWSGASARRFYASGEVKLRRNFPTTMHKNQDIVFLLLNVKRQVTFVPLCTFYSCTNSHCFHKRHCSQSFTDIYYKVLDWSCLRGLYSKNRRTNGRQDPLRCHGFSCERTQLSLESNTTNDKEAIHQLTLHSLPFVSSSSADDPSDTLHIPDSPTRHVANF